ncbi:hypothetical protein [Aureispira anguillae]|uniref:Uncharacterized protein n=1 Tax=Aureispira anguillae TaxID=2864201 RepID=A0A915YBX4_9BACT|nr:hypothetical protein [Aureispira anguillae]BDS10253.1 hypothetical protein AsAng_0009610 [Aureispira anguillae]
MKHLLVLLSFFLMINEYSIAQQQLIANSNTQKVKDGEKDVKIVIGKPAPKKMNQSEALSDEIRRQIELDLKERVENGNGRSSTGQTIIKHNFATKDIDRVAFSEERANKAKTENAEKKEAVKQSVLKGKATVIRAKDQIALAKDWLAEDKKNNKISEDEYRTRKANIERIEQKTKDLERKLLKGKESM